MTFRLLVGVASMLLLQNSAWQCDAFVYVSYPPAGAQCISRSGITSNAINVGISGGGPSAGAAALQVTAVQAYPAGVVGGRGSITALSAFPDRSNHDDIVARNIARTDVRNFLTQRAFQSFMFLAEECRDPHTGKWIQDFLGLQNMLEYHGSGALDIDRFRMWEASLVEMMEQPKDTVIVSAKRRGRGHGGWSKNNPYLPERWVEIPISIDPTSLTQRIMAVREQIGGEFVNDLAILRECNDMILDDYFAKVKATRDEQQQQGQNVESYSYMDDPSRVNPTAIAFDRVGANILNNHTAFASVASSPFRRGNFDLLYNLATQESVHKLLRSLQAAGEAKIVSFEWLRDFYIDKVEEYFDGSLEYGRADDFIEEFLLTSPSVIYTDDGKMGLADPLGLAEQIIQTRSIVLDEWQELMRQVPDDHSALRRLILDKQMAASGYKPFGSESGFQ